MAESRRAKPARVVEALLVAKSVRSPLSLSALTARAAPGVRRRPTYITPSRSKISAFIRLPPVMIPFPPEIFQAMPPLSIRKERSQSLGDRLY